MRRLFFAALLALSLLPARAQEAVPDEVARAVRAVIESQIEAFRRDDGAAAFELATPAIREAFGTADNFLRMVRESYGPVYRPASVSFQPPQVIDDELLQPVRIVDAQGHAWLAVYPMQKQPDGRWRTNGCQLFRIAGTSV